MSDYQIVHIDDIDGVCKLSTLHNVPQKYRFDKGTSCQQGFPDDALFKMHSSFPKDVRLVDALFNVSRLLVVSARFKELLESIPGALAHNEVLPVAIVNHKERTEKAPYFIVHQLDHPPCLDETQSTGTRSALEPDTFQFLDTVVLDAAKVPGDRKLFRVAQYPNIPFIRRDLAEALADASLVGISFVELEDYER